MWMYCIFLLTFIDLTFQVLLSNIQMISILGDVSRDLAALANSLLRIFRQERKEIVLIKTVATKEMEQEGKLEMEIFNSNISSEYKAY